MNINKKNDLEEFWNYREPYIIKSEIISNKNPLTNTSHSRFQTKGSFKKTPNFKNKKPIIKIVDDESVSSNLIHITNKTKENSQNGSAIKNNNEVQNFFKAYNQLKLKQNKQKQEQSNLRSRSVVHIRKSDNFDKKISDQITQLINENDKQNCYKLNYINKSIDTQICETQMKIKKLEILNKEKKECTFEPDLVTNKNQTIIYLKKELKKQSTKVLNELYKRGLISKEEFPSLSDENYLFSKFIGFNTNIYFTDYYRVKKLFK